MKIIIAMWYKTYFIKVQCEQNEEKTQGNIIEITKTPIWITVQYLILNISPKIHSHSPLY